MRKFFGALAPVCNNYVGPFSIASFCAQIPRHSPCVRVAWEGGSVSRTQHLPLYSASYVFVRETYRIRTKLPKLLKHDLGQEAFYSALKILKCIALANRAHDKDPHITRLLLEVEVEWVMLRLLYDLRGISEGEFKVLSERLTEIGRQAQAWLKWDKSRSGPRKATGPLAEEDGLK